MKKQQTDYRGTPKIRKYEPKEPDGIEIFGTGTTAPRDFVKHPTYLSRKAYLRYFLYADRFSFRAAALCVALMMIMGFAWACRPAIKAESSISISEAVPTMEPTPTPAPEITPTTVTIQLAPIVSRRTFMVTAYAVCMECCDKIDGIGFGGAKVQEGISIAADLSVLPLGTVVEIEGIGLRTVQDKGSHVIGDHVDLLLGSYEEALAFGVQYRVVMVFAKESGK